MIERGVVQPVSGEDLLGSYVCSLTNLRTTSNGVFSAKIHTNQWVDLCKFHEPHKKQVPSYYRQKLETTFVNPYFVFLYRKDILSQAISSYIAEESQSWSSEVPAKQSVEYDFEKIHSFLGAIMKYLRICRSIHKVTSFPKLSLTYEDLEEDYYGSIKRIASFLGEEVVLTDNIGENTVEKQGDQRNEEWKSRFLADLNKNR